MVPLFGSRVALGEIRRRVGRSGLGPCLVRGLRLRIGAPCKGP